MRLLYGSSRRARFMDVYIANARMIRQNSRTRSNNRPPVIDCLFPVRSPKPHIRAHAQNQRRNWGEPERAPPRALQRLRSLSHNNGNDGGISYVLPNAHARSLRGEFKGQSRQSESQGKRERYRCASESAQHREMRSVR